MTGARSETRAMPATGGEQSVQRSIQEPAGREKDEETSKAPVDDQPGDGLDWDAAGRRPEAAHIPPEFTLCYKTTHKGGARCAAFSADGKQPLARLESLYFVL